MKAERKTVMNPLLKHLACLTRRHFFGRGVPGLGVAALLALFSVVSATAAGAEPVAIHLERQRFVVRPGEPFEAAVVLSNRTAAPVTVAARVWIEKDLVTEVPLAQETVTLSAGGSWRKAVSWKPEAEEWGCALKASCADREGKPLARASVVFSVSDNVARTSVNYGYLPSLSTRAFADRVIAQYERQAVTLVEMMGHWDPPSYWTDWGLQRDWWVGGHGGMARSREMIKRSVAAARDRGIGVTFYWANAHTGIAGLDHVLKNPRSALYDNPEAKVWLGEEQRRLLDQMRQWDPEKQGNFKYPRLFPGHAALFWMEANGLDPETLEAGIRTICDGMREYGCDGIRTDFYPLQFVRPAWNWSRHQPLNGLTQGWYDWQGRPLHQLVKDHDQECARINTWFRDQIRKEFPRFLINYNTWDVNYWKQTPQTAAALYAGHYAMDESLGTAPTPDGKTVTIKVNRQWDDYRRRVLYSRRESGKVGAYLYGGHGSHSRFNESFCRHLIPLLHASGVRPQTGDDKAGDFFRFSLRYSRLFFDPARMVADPQSRVRPYHLDEQSFLEHPDFPASDNFRVDRGARPGADDLWWRDYGYTRASGDRVTLVVHLVNRPKTAELQPADQPEPDVVADTSVRAFVGDWKLNHVRLLSPEYDDWSLAPETRRDGAFVVVKVPPFRYWAVFVMELAGRFTPPQRAPGEKPFP